MGFPKAIHKMTAAEYSEWELDEPERHEFFRGEVIRVFAMGGARREHVTVSDNCYAELRQHLRGSGCQAFLADMKMLEEYALVDPHAKTFEVYRRQPNGSDWLLSPGRAGHGLELQSVALTIPVDALFENV